MSYPLASPGSWFATQVWSGRELMCAARLRLRGYTAFVPCYQERRRWSDRVKTLEKPLFAGYVFCCVGGDTFDKIVTTPDVIRIVGDGGGPIPIPAEEIEALQRVAATGLSATPAPYIEVGDRIRIDIGPLRGTEGIVLRTQSINRLFVSISLLRRSVSVELDPSWVSVTPETLVAAATKSSY